MQTPTLFSESQQSERYVIAIDPGRNTGIAIFNITKKKIIKLLTLDFWGTIDLISSFQYHFEVIIEDPQMNKPVFYDEETPIPVVLAKAQRVGRNKEAAYLMAEYMLKKKIFFKPVRPGNKKWNPEEFFLKTGWEGKSNQHTRDAAKLLLTLLQ